MKLPFGMKLPNLSSLFSRSPSAIPIELTYKDVFEVMRYNRGMDAMPYAVGYRPKPPVVDPTGPEPNFALLETAAEVEAFMAALNLPLVMEPHHGPDRPAVISLVPLAAWNEMPSSLMAELMLIGFYHPDDETKDWPLLQIFGLPPDMFISGVATSANTVRGRYNFRQFPPKDKEIYVAELQERRSNTGVSDIFIIGELPFSVLNALNPRVSGQKLH